MRIHIAESYEFPAEVLCSICPADWLWYGSDYNADLTTTANADILWVRLADYVGVDYLNRFQYLQTIVTPTTGLNHIDLDECERRGITVLSLAGEVDFLQQIRSTAELTIGLMLSLLRKIPAAVESVKRGEWDRDKFKGRDLAGKLVCIIGYGRVGYQVARTLDTMGAKIISKQFPGDSDIYTLHANYTPGNDKMCDAKFFASMKPGALFINTARGELVDEEALLQALDMRHLGGAALDVMTNEQYHANSEHAATAPIITYAREHSNLIITPHIGGCTHESMEKAELFMAHKLIEHLKTREAAPA